MNKHCNKLLHDKIEGIVSSKQMRRPLPRSNAIRKSLGVRSEGSLQLSPEDLRQTRNFPRLENSIPQKLRGNSTLPNTFPHYLRNGRKIYPSIALFNYDHFSFFFCFSASSRVAFHMRCANSCVLRTIAIQ